MNAKEKLITFLFGIYLLLFSAFIYNYPDTTDFIQYIPEPLECPKCEEAMFEPVACNCPTCVECPLVQEKVCPQCEEKVCPKCEDKICPQCQDCSKVEPLVKEKAVRAVYPIHSFQSAFLETRESIYGKHPCHSVKATGMIEWLHECSKGHEFVWVSSAGALRFYQAILQYFDMTAHFGYLNNVFLICIDLKCKSICDRQSFPCYYNPETEGMNHMAFVNHFKLLELPKLLRLGVNVMFIDLDVSFKDDPMKVFLPLSDLSWDAQFQKQSGGEGAVNIGLMFVRGIEKTAKLFEDSYAIREFYNRTFIDQIGVQKVLELKETDIKYTMNDENFRNLLHVYGRDWEVGGEETDKYFGAESIGFHSTCYETGMKSLILQTVGAWWINNYCDSRIQTLTLDKLDFVSVDETKKQVYSLILLTQTLERTLKLPHLIVNEKKIPFARAVSAESLTNGNFPYVENGYHYRCKQRTGRTPTQGFITVNENENFYSFVSRIQKKLDEEGPIQDLQIRGKLPIVQYPEMLIPFKVHFCPALNNNQLTSKPPCLNYCKI